MIHEQFFLEEDYEQVAQLLSIAVGNHITSDMITSIIPYRNEHKLLKNSVDNWNTINDYGQNIFYIGDLYITANGDGMAGNEYNFVVQGKIDTEVVTYLLNSNINQDYRYGAQRELFNCCVNEFDFSTGTTNFWRFVGYKVVLTTAYGVNRPVGVDRTEVAPIK